MQVFPNSYLFTFPKPLNPPSPLFHFRPPPPPLLLRKPPLTTVAKAFSSDEFPVDETFLKAFAPKETGSEDANEDDDRKRSWELGWAPWEQILTPEAQFAVHSIDEGEEVPLQRPESIESFKMLKPSYRKKRIEEMGLTEEEYLEKQFEIKTQIPEPLETKWAGPLVVRLVPPRDWPPRGWEVDRKELEFIREAHKMQAKRVRLEDIENGVKTETDDVCLDRYKVFLKQYNEWVEANKDLLEEESYKLDQDYHPGRRKRGKDYKEGMYELPFYYPGQICVGKVTTLHLYQGAFIDIGGVYDGWVPIKSNDWFWIRHHINVGMTVIVEITAKRDPYRFRFPIELRFVDPNIDHLIFNKFEFPPIFHREEETNPDELRRDCGRPPLPRKDPGDKPVEEPLLSNHPYVDKLWQIHVAEQMILNDMDVNPDKYKGKKLSDLVDEDDFDEENSVQHTKVHYKNALVPKVTLKTSVKELDLEAALAEYEHHKKLWKEAKDRGEEYKITALKRNIEMDEYDFMHWRRSFEEREALIRDISCRKTLGLPLEEPGRYVDASFFGKDVYDPENPVYSNDYMGEHEHSEKSRQERRTDTHNKSIVGNGTVWYEMPYDDSIKHQDKEFDEYTKQDEADEEEDDEDDDDFDFSILRKLRNNDVANQIHVNGTETSTLPDEGVIEE